MCSPHISHHPRACPACWFLVCSRTSFSQRKFQKYLQMAKGIVDRLPPEEGDSALVRSTYWLPCACVTLVTMHTPPPSAPPRNTIVCTASQGRGVRQRGLLEIAAMQAAAPQTLPFRLTYVEEYVTCKMFRCGICGNDGVRRPTLSLIFPVKLCWCGRWLDLSTLGRSRDGARAASRPFPPPGK